MQLQQPGGTRGTVGTLPPGRPNLSALPEILFAEDIGAAFRVSTGQARQNLSAGLYGPRFRLGRRWGILRTALLDHLSRMSAMPIEPDPDATGRGTAVLDLISRRRADMPKAN